MLIILASGALGLAATAYLYGRMPHRSQSLTATRAPAKTVAPTAQAARAECLPSGDGFFRARLDGALERRLDWPNSGTSCEGMPRPDGNGIRLSFRNPGEAQQGLLIVLGIAGLSESSSGRALPANVTIIDGPSGRVFGTRGDDKCTVDELRQELLTPWSESSRRYRVTGKGFCIQPATTMDGGDTVLMSTFDFAGVVSYEGAAPASSAAVGA